MKDIHSEIRKRVLVLDGALGTMVQQYSLSEKDYRGRRFKSSGIPLKGNHDLLCITQPKIISGIHEQYLAAGADIIETNTFNSNRISMATYEIGNLVPELNLAAAKIAVKAAEKYSLHTPEKPRFVAGSIGPTHKSVSNSQPFKMPGSGHVTSIDLYNAYREQAENLINGGVDLLLVETIFDMENAAVAVKAILDLFNSRKISLPLMISLTLPANCSHLLSGHSIEMFLQTISFPSQFSVGINCSVASKDLKPYLRILSDNASCYVSLHPNAGFPDKSGKFPVSAKQMAVVIKDFLDERLVNIIGGCCGTTPDYISRLTELAALANPREVC